MNRQPRKFEDAPSQRVATGLLIGITGPSFSGKTFSAFRLATGMQRVTGGEIFMIDTEARRGQHYSDRFKFRHVDMAAPFGPLDYLDAIKYAVSKGARIIVVDSMSHEHSGEGGVLDQSERLLETKRPEDRDKWLMNSLVEPKKQRKKLNRAIEQLGRECIHIILCYRAVDKIKPVPGQAPKKLGWQPDTTSTLMYEMTQRFLLPPASDGIPSYSPQHNEEKLLVKTPVQFRDWFKPGQPISEDMGERMARWAAGDGAAPQSQPASQPRSERRSDPPPASDDGVPRFRPRVEWDGADEWGGKLLAEAPLEALSDYSAALDRIPAAQMKPDRRKDFQQHVRDVTAAIARLEPDGDGDPGYQDEDAAE